MRAEFDARKGIATIVMERDGRANRIDEAFGRGLSAALDAALAHEGLRGIVLTGGQGDFCVGADLDLVFRLRTPAEVDALTTPLHALFRRIETCGVPVVAALNGSALGGGYELALACHRRIALDSPDLRVGLPEVSLGLIPGAGGTQRLPRLIGLQGALEHIARGAVLRGREALAAGLIDGLVPDLSALRTAAEEWIASNPDPRQPWDRPGFAYPGPRPGSDDARNLFAVASAMLFRKTAGAFPAPEAAISAIYEGTALHLDAALKVEARYFAARATSDNARDMIRTFWFFRKAVEKHEGLPRSEDPPFRKVGIVGAGMMGSGLAFVCARRGFEVVLKDVRKEALDRALAHCRDQLATRGRDLSRDEQEALLGRIHGTLETHDLAGCDLIIEAVFEDLTLKHQVTREAEAVLGDDAVFASNTSALPITELAKASRNAANFIGLHFFSPVEQMPLVEVVLGRETSERTLARALDFCRRIQKMPVVVNDGYGFYLTRLFSAYILEGVRLVAEGCDPVLVEWAARTAGMAVPPLKVFDEVTLTLGLHVVESGEKLLGRPLGPPDDPGLRLLRRMVELGRTGKAAGKGFYDYEARPRRLWSGLRDLVDSRSVPEDSGLDAIRRRLMLAQVVEAARCLDEGILRNRRDAEVGAVFGVGFAPQSGGPLAFMDRTGIPAVVAALDDLARRHGDRFLPPPLLRRMAERGELFHEDPSPAPVPAGRPARPAVEVTTV